MTSTPKRVNGGVTSVMRRPTYDREMLELQ